MGDAEAFDVAEDFEGVETRHDHVGGAESEHGERDYSGCVRKRGYAEADRIAGGAAPVMRSHFRHGAPAEAGDADTFGWSSGAAGGNEAYEPIGIAAGVGPVELIYGGIAGVGIRAPSHEFFERGIFSVFGVNADQVSERGDARLKSGDAVAIAAVVEEPGSFLVIEILGVGAGRVAVIDGDPDSPGAHEAEHAEENARVVDGIDGDGLFAAQAGGPQGAGDLLAGSAHVGVGVTRAALDDGDAIGECFGLLVEIIYGSHGCASLVERFGDGLRLRGAVSDVGGFFQEQRYQE